MAQVRSKWISESCSTAFFGPLCKNLWGVHFFKFSLSFLQLGILTVFWAFSVICFNLQIWQSSPIQGGSLLYLFFVCHAWLFFYQRTFSFFVSQISVVLVSITSAFISVATLTPLWEKWLSCDFVHFNNDWHYFIEF